VFPQTIHAPTAPGDMVHSGVSTALRIPASHSAVPFVRFTIVALLGRQGWHPEPICRVMLAASEALSNAIEHGSPPDGRIDVRLIADRGSAELSVRDQGRPDRRRVILPPGPPPDNSPNGRGLIILERISERLELRPAGAGTELVAGFIAFAPAEVDAA
jgi:anti-sigma regulatory factor (Ser/Thr protein kinase)